MLPLAGLLNLKEGGEREQATMDTVLLQRVPQGEKDRIKKLLKQASAAWWLAGHPGWAIWPVDTQHFMHDMSAPVSLPMVTEDLPKYKPHLLSQLHFCTIPQ